MAVKIRLKRLGKTRSPHYRSVVADSRTKRDGRAIEEIGRYVPTTHPSIIEINSERAQYWLSVGAQPTEQALVLLKLTGDYQASKGQKAENKVQFAEPKAAFVADGAKKPVLLPKEEPKKKASEAESAEASETSEPVADQTDAPVVEAEAPAAEAEPAATEAEAPADAAAPAEEA